MERKPITATGYKRLEKELHELKKVQRPAVIESIAVAREHGDLKENAEYHAAKEKQGFIEGRIMNLEGIFSAAQIFDPLSMKGEKQVKFSATVTLYDVESEKEVIYQIVSEYEANIEKGLISATSPVSRSLIGKIEGDEVEVRTPGGVREYEIMKVEYK